MRAGKRRGFEVEASAPPVTYYGLPKAAASVLLIHGQELTLRLVEPLRRSEHVPTEAELRRSSVWPPPEYDYAPSGELQLEIEGSDAGARRRRWRDSSKRRLEDVLGEVFVELVRIAELRNESDRRREEQRQRVAEEMARREAVQAAREAELVRRRQLEVDAANWTKAEQVRAYVRAVVDESPVTGGERLEVWVEWALGHADRLDPMRPVDAEDGLP